MISDRAILKLKKREEKKEKDSMRQRMIDNDICPDCGRNLIIKDHGYSFSMVCPMHGAFIDHYVKNLYI